MDDDLEGMYEERYESDIDSWEDEQVFRDGMYEAAEFDDEAAEEGREAEEADREFED